MVDYSIGQGMDILTTLNYYGFGDPISLLSVFANKNTIEGMYAFIIFLRLYAAGISFSWYCMYTNRFRKYAVLVGALIYSFCGTALYSSVRHPFFILGMIYLPLFLLGVEKFLKTKKPYFFIFSVALSLISNFYFAYINTILMTVYVALRIIFLGDGELKSRIIKTFKLILSYITGVFLSAVVFFPVVYAYFNNARTDEIGGYESSLWVYNPDYYKNFFGAMTIENPNFGYWTNLYFTALCIPAIILLFYHSARSKKDKDERNTHLIIKTAAILLTIFALVPIFGKIFNGFGYISNRWIYGYAFIIAIVIIYELPNLLKMNIFEKAAVVVVSFIYMRFIYINNNITVFEVKSAIIGVLVIAAVLVIFSSLHKLKWKNIIFESVILIFTVISLFINIKALYAPENINYISQFLDYGTAVDFIESSSSQAALGEEDNEFYRVETPKSRGNSSLLLNTKPNSYYYSIVPKLVSDYYDELGLNTLARQFILKNLDARTFIMELSSTKYFTQDKKLSKMIPYGYSFVKDDAAQDGSMDELYINNYYVSPGITFDKYMTTKEYSKLNSIQRQEALMQCVITDNNTGSLKEVTSEDINIDSNELPFEIAASKGVKVEEGLISADKKKSYITIKFDKKSDSETYILFKNLQNVSADQSVNRIKFISSGGKNVIELHSPSNC